MGKWGAEPKSKGQALMGLSHSPGLCILSLLGWGLRKEWWGLAQGPVAAADHSL